ncbi:von Willebrand factor type A domain-containing protein [Formosa sp. Hel1_31_208]|uniref:vWA domain-containing protein n=1 Tax=Formosa sp. Hel1_31_208 TaxID=1798225 RepID=UPI00087A8256|nr:vWA domain-containing protein [Formosa sp. Hel1_31_208]SDR67130.1 von Willebrand factor type A domain-containing protein [Formosa sp. Hel1_31_208]
MKTIFRTIAISLCMINILSCNANEKKEQAQVAFIEPTTHHLHNQFIKVALLLDTSNSMDGLIDQAKAQLWDIVNELSYAKCGDEKPNLQIALYEYGNDNLNSEEGYIRQVLAFSRDLDEISKQLFSLTTNGGNEYCGHVIQTALNQLNWGKNEDDLKLMFIAGNEPFTQGKINYQDATKQSYKKGVSVNTIFCGDYNQGITTYWKDGAERTNGDYMAINHNQATTHVATPYDDRILQLNHKLNKTYVAYGSVGRQKIALQTEQDTNAMDYSEANAVSRTVSKSSHLYKNSTWDLVDAANEKGFKYEALKKDDLPKDLQEKSVAELKRYITKKGLEREQVQKEIKQLNEKRRLYIASQQKENDNGLENAMIKAIKTQAKEKKYTW